MDAPSESPTVPPRLFLLQARAAPFALIFRRGPSRWVELIGWDTDRDVFERGHWFHGRIYERRCDLSPDGSKLLYFARKYGIERSIEAGYTESWTAISRPPWLTALALWPKGDSWHGGGAFLDDRRVLLNHRPEHAVPHPRHLPQGIAVEADPDAGGEDDPVYSRRLEREGWIWTHEGRSRWTGWPGGYVTEQAGLMERPRGDVRIVLRREVVRYSRRETFTLAGVQGDGGFPADVDWADWDGRGRLIVLGSGRVEARSVEGNRVGEGQTLIDLNADTFEARKSPPWAKSWGRQRGTRRSRGVSAGDGDVGD